MSTVFATSTAPGGNARHAQRDTFSDGDWGSRSVANLQPIAPIDALVGLIYRGPLEPLPWKQFLGALRIRAKSSFAAIVLRGSRPGARPLVVMDGKGDVSIRLQPAAADHARLAAFDPLGQALEKPGDIFTLDEVMPWDLYRTTDFYNSIIQPYGIRHQVGMSFSACGWKCNVGMMNVEGMPSFGKQEKDLLLSFLPHLRASLEIYSVIRREQGMRAALSETLDQLDVGTFILDACGKVMVSNRSGQNLVHSGKGISLIDSRLVFARKTDNGRLSVLVGKAFDWSQSNRKGAWIDGLSVDCDDGHVLGVLVKAIANSAQFDGELGPRVALYIRDPDQQRPLPERLISRLFGLTTREAKLAQLLSSGMSLAEAADQLNIRINTARTYSKTIFSKVGVHRQSQLVRLILGSVTTLA